MSKQIAKTTKKTEQILPRGMRDWEDELEFVNTGNNQHQEQLERFAWILALPDDKVESERCDRA